MTVLFSKGPYETHGNQEEQEAPQEEKPGLAKEADGCKEVTLLYYQ